MQPVTIIRVQTPVCAVPGCFCPSAAIVRCAGYATHTSPARAPPRRSCRATTSSLSRPTYLLLPAPSRAAPHRREKKRKQTRRAPRRTPHPRPPLFCPLWPALSFCNEAREAGGSRLVFPHAYLHNKQSVLGLSRLFAGPCSVSAAGTAIVAVAGSPFLLHHTDSSGAGCCVDRACLCLLSVWSCLSAGRLSPQHTPAPPLLALLTVHSRLFLVLARQLL